MTVKTVDLNVVTHPFRNKTLVFKQFSNYVRCFILKIFKIQNIPIFYFIYIGTSKI